MAACVLAVAFGPASPLPAQSGRFGFDDAHVHLNRPAEWMRLMNDAGMGFAVVLRGRHMDNEGLRDAAERWPGRLIPFLSVSPEHSEYRDYWIRDDPSLATIADSLLSTGSYYGIGEISVSHFPAPGFPEADFKPNGRLMHALLEAARRHGVPILVHVEIPRLSEFEALLETFRDVRVIWAHGGYTSADEARRLLTRHSNLVYELSARTWRRHPRSPSYTILRDGNDIRPEWIRLIESMPGRFLVGTDAAQRSTASDERKIESVRNLLDQLAPDVRDKVAHENLKRLVPPRGVGP